MSLELRIDDEGRMVDEQPLDAALLGLVEQRPDFADVQMAGGEHAVILGDLIEDRLEFVLELAGVGDHGEAGRAQHLAFGRQDDVSVAVAQVISRAEGRHPDDACAELDAVLDSVRVEAADRVIERHA